MVRPLHTCISSEVEVEMKKIELTRQEKRGKKRKTDDNVAREGKRGKVVLKRLVKTWTEGKREANESGAGA